MSASCADCLRLDVLSPGGPAFHPLADLPTPRCKLAAACPTPEQWDTAGVLLLGGGRQGPPPPSGGAPAVESLAVVERYVPARDEWLPAPAMRSPRFGLAAAAFQGSVFAIGAPPFSPRTPPRIPHGHPRKHLTSNLSPRTRSRAALAG